MIVETEWVRPFGEKLKKKRTNSSVTLKKIHIMRGVSRNFISKGSSDSTT